MRLQSVEQCRETRILAGKVFVCVKPDHSWHHKSGESVALYRRRQGKVPAPDQHVFRKVEE